MVKLPMISRIWPIFFIAGILGATYEGGVQRFISESFKASTKEEARDLRFVTSTKKEVTSPKESSPVGLVLMERMRL